MNTTATTRTQVALLLITLLGFAGVSCFLLYMFIQVSIHSFNDTGKPLPFATRLCLDFRFAILLLPAPWLAVAVRMITRNDASTFHLTAFSSTLLIALLNIALFVIITLAIPWLPLSTRLSHP